LKQPGVVPAGAGGDGGEMGEFVPFAWQSTHTGAFAWFVLVWLYVLSGSHDVG